MLLHHLAPKVYGFTPWFVYINFSKGLPLPTEPLGTDTDEDLRVETSCIE